ncbi:MAG: FtsX-like permease family protein, partial [Wujia sp.]
MLFKLSLRNIKRSIQNYLIYFATLILGVAIFYVFNALGTQTVMLRVSSDTREMISYMMDVMSVVSVFVSVVLGFLIVYASTFLMKRRKKEFGIYMLLGMGKARVSLVLIIETILIGILSLGVGLLLGVAASQGMSIIVANMFEADMTAFEFVASKSAVVKTLVYFVIMYAIVILLDAIVVGKAKLITLIQAGKRTQKNHAKNPVLCVIVFIVACVMLGSAYYNVTAGATELKHLSDVGIQVGKGIVSTFLIFWSVSGLLLVLVKRCKRFYYKGVNSFSVQELGNRINTTVFSGSIICLLLFFTICILSSAMAIKNATNATLRACAPMDVQFHTYPIPEEDGTVREASVREYLEEAGVDLSKLKDMTELTEHNNGSIMLGDVVGDAVKQFGGSEEYQNYMKESPMPVVFLSEYNTFLASFGKDPVTLAE